MDRCSSCRPTLLPASQAGVDAYQARAPPRPATRSISPGSTGSAGAAKCRFRSDREAFSTCGRSPRAVPPRPISASARMKSRSRRPVAAVADECDWPIAIWQSSDLGRRAEARRGPFRAVHKAGSLPAPRSTTPRCSAGRRARPVSGPSFRDARPRHRAAARLPGAARAGHQLRARRVGRPAELPRDFRPEARCRRRDPVGLRHGRLGDRRGKPRGRHRHRRQLCARRAGPRLRRRRRPFGRRQPLAGAGYNMTRPSGWSAAWSGRSRGSRSPARWSRRRKS